MRRSSSLDALIPALYLNGVSTDDYSQALSANLGTDASCISLSVIERLKETWLEEYDEWKQRDLSNKRYVYLWADGIFFNVRLANDRPSVLVIMGACLNGKKELVGILDGERENTLSWKELLLQLKQHGLHHPPVLSISDGALGFSRALEEVYGKTRHQRCWGHKTANILDTMPRSVHAEAKRHLHDIAMAPSKRDALNVFDLFLALFEAKYPKACASLKKDKEQLLSFYDFPIDHWKHLRTGSLIDATFATVRHRRRMTKGCGSQDTTLSMVCKLGREMEKHWRRLNNHELLLRYAGGADGVDGQEQPLQAGENRHV
jgi:transposase-like protein